MRKEYSDLPDRQKIVYIKRSAIYWACCLVPLAITGGLLLAALGSYEDTIKDMPKVDTKANNSTVGETPTRTSAWFDFRLILVMILFFASTSGLITLGLSLGDWLANRLNLYTDFELESAERRVAEIKKVLEK